MTHGFTHVRSIGPPSFASKSSLRYSRNNIILTEPHPLPITNAIYCMLRPVYILAAVLLCACALDAAQRKDPLVHVVKRGDTLSGIAARYRVPLVQIYRWNKLKDDAIRLDQRLQVWPPAQPGDWYIVRPGDNLSQIAARFSAPVRRLKTLNPLKGDTIQPGQKLRLHTAAAPAQQQARAEKNSPPTGLLHTVQPGETLSQIAIAYGLELTRLKALNQLKGDTIQPGQKLTVAAAKPASSRDAEPREYTVRPGDTLSQIALRFDVGLGLLRQLNPLKGDTIQPGQKLRLRPSPLEEAVHVVQAGETLSAIALRYRVEVVALRHLNGIESDQIFAGQKLRLKDASSAIHIVERGDALWEIARAYDVSVDQLKELNGLSSNRIYPGQELKLSGAPAPRLAIYTIQPGDYLGQIARLHQMSIAEITRINKLAGTVIHPGDQLKVRPMRWLELSAIDWDALEVDRAPKIALGNGPYYYTRPRNARQLSKTYYEGHPHSPRRTYRQAARLWQDFERKVATLGRLSDRLEGWHIVLDPGHGGLDPGAVVPTLDGNGNKLYVVEDEYVFDIALRVYVLLRLHGANATLTLLSPNHLIRHNARPTLTFVNEKNEVYNSAAHNQTNKRSDWPRGGNLSTRVRIAREAFKKTAPGRRVFLSFHADIDTKAPEAPLVLFYESQNGRRLDRASRLFARTLLPALGAGARIRGQGLGVLRNNPADVKVLIELRNMAYRDHVWALRFEQLRHRDAEKVVRGLLDYAQRANLSARR
jgi:LysM repeat protein/N-acetylmuramoyl-L-alanine amidase